MKWRAKGLVQKALSVAPGGRWMNDRLQRSIGSFRRFDAESNTKIDDFYLMATQLLDAGFPIADARFLEIGPGWYPTLPICLYLAGVRRVASFDLTRHLQADLTLKLVKKLAAHTVKIAELAAVSPPDVEQRRARLERGLENGEPIGAASEYVIDYQAPADAAKTGLPPHEVDVVFSNSVLEHIPKPVLEAIFAESWRILRPGGIVFHSVNCGDHYAYTDSTVGQLNYLQFSSREWELLWNNDVQYQNRLRAVDFVSMAQKHEFQIVRDTSKVLPERLDELRRLPKIAPEFRRYSEEELCLTTVDFIGRKEL